jgi:hypothetical protein
MIRALGMAGIKPRSPLIKAMSPLTYHKITVQLMQLEFSFFLYAENDLQSFSEIFCHI